jgi:hypothetical protein
VTSARAPFTPRDRRSALTKLVEFALSDDLGKEMQIASLEFWADWLDAHGDDEVGEAGVTLELSGDAFVTWFALDFPLDDGDAVVERLLRRRAARLRPGEREYLERMRDTHLRPYQVVDVQPGGGGLA